MASDKNVLIQLMMAKVEASYGAATTVTGSTDAVSFVDQPEFTIAYAYDGAQGTAPGTLGQYRRNAPSGRYATGKVKLYAKGTGTAYTSASLPPANAFLLASGLSGSIAAGAVTYAPYPVGTGPVSGSSIYIEAYRRGEKWPLTAGYCNMTLGTSNAAAPVFEFDVQALTTIPTDAPTPPAAVYQYTTIVPPKAENIQLSVGTWTTAKVRNFKFELGRAISPRTDIASATGHAGFQPGQRKPKLHITVESCPLATFDPYTTMSTGALVNVSAIIGSVTNNKYTLTVPYGTLTAVTPNADGPVATWELVFDATTSTPNSNDDFSLVYQ